MITTNNLDLLRGMAIYLELNDISQKEIDELYELIGSLRETTWYYEENRPKYGPLFKGETVWCLVGNLRVSLCRLHTTNGILNRRLQTHRTIYQCSLQWIDSFRLIYLAYMDFGCCHFFYSRTQDELIQNGEGESWIPMTFHKVKTFAVKPSHS